MDFMHYLKTRTASLMTELDKRLLVVLRDGRTLIGELSSFDQFGMKEILVSMYVDNEEKKLTILANLVLINTIERIHVGKQYGDINRGVFVVRGENVVLLGEIDPQKEKAIEEKNVLTEVSMEEILEAQRLDIIDKEQLEKQKNQLRHDRGLPPHMPDMGLDDFA